MNKRLRLTALAIWTVAAANAATITISFDNPYQTGSPGQTLQFYGTITNTDTTPGGASIYLNSDSLNLLLPDASFIDQFYSLWFPLSLAPGESSGSIDLFEVTLANPGTSPDGPYAGTYTLLGGMDGGDQSAMDSLAEATFTVDVQTVPEPGTWALLGFGLLLVPLARPQAVAQAAIARSFS